MLALLIVLVLVLFNGFFAMSEMAVMTSRRSRLRQMAQSSRTAAKALHRLTPLVYAMGVAHALGAGSDRRTIAVLLIATGTPILYLGILRALPAATAPSASRAGSV